MLRLQGIAERKADPLLVQFFLGDLLVARRFQEAHQLRVRWGEYRSSKLWFCNFWSGFPLRRQASKTSQL